MVQHQIISHDSKIEEWLDFYLPKNNSYTSLIARMVRNRCIPNV